MTTLRTRRTLRALVVGAVAVASGAGGCTPAAPAADAVVATVDGEPITMEELRSWMLFHRAGVHAHFFREYAVHDEEGFWSATYGGERPIELLRERAMHDAVRRKVQQLHARRAGAAAPIAYGEMMAERLRLNRERRAAVDRGEVVFGPVEYTPRVYYDLLFDRAVRVLKDSLAAPGDLALDAEAPALAGREQFGAEPAVAVDRAGPFLRLQQVDRRYDGYVDAWVVAAEVRIVPHVLRGADFRRHRP